MITPYPYQVVGPRLIDKFDGRALLADEMGLGKSMQAVRYFAHFLPSDAVMVVVCPASVKYHWEREIKLNSQIAAEVLESTSPRPDRRFWSARALVINYDILSHWLPLLRERRPTLVVIDEGQYIKNRGTRRAKAVRKLCYKVPNIIVCSGTPLTNRPAELFNCLNLLRPDEFPSFYTFGHRYCDATLTPWGWKYPGARHLKELHKLLKQTCMIRRRKVDVLEDLPPKSRHVVPMGLSNPEEYQEAFRDFLRWLRKNWGLDRAKRAARAEALSRRSYLRQLIARLKMKSMLEWVNDFFEETNEKLILFAVNHKVIDQFEEAHKKHCVVVTGEVTGRRRQRAVDEFTLNKRVRLFIGQLDAAGVGWNGTAASTVAFTQLGDTPGQHIQAEDRPHRIGQDKPVSAYYLLGKDTFEEDLCRMIQRKHRHLSAVLDGKVNRDDSLDLFDMLCSQLLEEK